MLISRIGKRAYVVDIDDTSTLNPAQSAPARLQFQQLVTASEGQR